MIRCDVRNCLGELLKKTSSIDPVNMMVSRQICYYCEQAGWPISKEFIYKLLFHSYIAPLVQSRHIHLLTRPHSHLTLLNNNIQGTINNIRTVLLKIHCYSTFHNSTQDNPNLEKLYLYSSCNI